MSEVDTVLDQEELMDQEVEDSLSQEVEDTEDYINPVRSFVDALQSGSFNNAETLFNDILGDKVQDALDAEKMAVADQIFNGADPVDLNDEEDDIELEDDTSEVEYGSEAEEFGSLEAKDEA